MPVPTIRNIETIPGMYGGGGVEAPIVLILDQFTDTDAVKVSAHTISPTNVPATAWSYVGGALDYLKIYSNKARSQAGSYLTVDKLDAGIADCIISVDMVCGGDGGWCGISFRVTDINNYWYAVVSKIAATYYLRIYEVTDGAAAVMRAGASPVFGDADTVTMTVTLAGNSISVTMAGTTISYTSAVRNTVTAHGLYVTGSVATLDNFKITTNP